MGKKAGRQPPTRPDVRTEGLEPATLGRSIAQSLSVKGFCVIDPNVHDEHLENVLGDISMVEEQGRFAAVPAAVLEGLLGATGSSRVADVGVSPEDALVSVHADSFPRDGGSLRHFDAELTRYANLLSPFLAQAGMPVSCRSSALLHEAAKPKSDGPVLTEEACIRWLKLFGVHRVMCIWCLGPENGELLLAPFGDEAQEIKVTMRPGRLVIARADAVSHRVTSVGCAYCLTCFFCNGNPAGETYQDPCTPCGMALKHWSEARMERFKDATVQEKRYMDMPREWEEKANREKINAQRIAMRSCSMKQCGSEDASAWALSFNSGPDYALQVPLMRWSHDNYYDEEGFDTMAFNRWKTNCNHGVFIDGVELFDCQAFRISRAEASGMDPGHRLTLETGYEALMRDGYKAKDLMNSRGGVYVANPPATEWHGTPKDIVGGGVCGGGGSIACGRFSFVHGMKGPCLSVDVEGASSLMAVNYACTNLSRTGKWEPIPFALINSWNLQLNVTPYIHLSANGLLSPKGRTFTFDASASGYIRGDCVVSLTLKALTENIDGQEVIKDDGKAFGHLAGSATNQSGRRSHLTAPDCMAMQEVIHEAIRQADISNLDMDCCECSADARVLDDSLETTAIARALRPQGTVNVDEAAPVAICSTKSGAGNQLEAMGLSQIIKVAIGASIGATHPTPHLRILNPHIDLEICERNAYLPSEALDFRLQSQFTGIMNRSIAGTNCYTVMFAKAADHLFRPRTPAGPEKEKIMPIVFWPKSNEIYLDITPKFGYSVVGTFNRWRHQTMEQEGPGVFAFTITMGENRWERFQITVDSDNSRTLHPMLPQAGKCSPVAGPEAVLRMMSWQINGLPKAKDKTKKALEAQQSSEAIVPAAALGGGAKAIVPDSFPDLDEEILGFPGDRFRIRLHVQGRWRMVDWEKLPEEPDAVETRARAARQDPTDYQVVGSWSLFAAEAMKQPAKASGWHQVEVTLPVDGQHSFYIIRIGDWDQAIAPRDAAVALQPGKACLRSRDYAGGLRVWSFAGSAGDVLRIEFQRATEDAEDRMQVRWDRIATKAQVPEELRLLHSRTKYFAKFQWKESGEEDLYAMHWTGKYYQFFVQLNGPEVGFLLFEDANMDKCLYPSCNYANPHEPHELRGPAREPTESEGLSWTIGSHEKDEGEAMARYEIRLHLDDEGRPEKVDWERLKSMDGLEEAAARGYYLCWLPAVPEQ